MKDARLWAWHRVGELLGEITDRLRPKGVSVSVTHNPDTDCADVTAHIRIRGQTFMMQRGYPMSDLAYAINREIVAYANLFAREFIDRAANGNHGDPEASIR